MFPWVVLGLGGGAIAAYLANNNVPAIWEAATDDERRVLIDELLDGVEVHSDHVEVIVRAAPRLNVTLEEVGLSGPKGENRRCRRAVVGGLRLASSRLERGRDNDA